MVDRTMNDRIRQLAEQARAWVNDTNNVAPDIEYVFYKDAYDKKFAELIVKESIDYCGENLSKTVGGALKIHFGVDE